MGIGPVEAVKTALARSGLKKDDIDLWDVNEVHSVFITNDTKSDNVVSRPSPRNGSPYKKSLSFPMIKAISSEVRLPSLTHLGHLARGTGSWYEFG